MTRAGSVYIKGLTIPQHFVIAADNLEKINNHQSKRHFRKCIHRSETTTKQLAA